MVDSGTPFRKLVENAPVGVFRVDGSGELLYANDTLSSMLGFESTDQLDSADAQLQYDDPDARDEFYRRVEDEGFVDGFEIELITADGEPVDLLLTGTLEDGVITGYATDVTDRVELRRKAEEQAEAILELSTPVVQIWEGITLATVIGTLDTERAQQLTEELLTEISEMESQVALVDITGVPSIDTATAQHLIDTVSAVTLLGSEVIITGINPEIAQTLVHLGVSMPDIETRSSLSEGLEHALELLDKDVESQPETEA